VGRLVVAAGDLATAPAPSPAALRGHDATVRRLAATTAAVLPVRFGTLVADAGELGRCVRPRARELRAALALVAGREQMTLRVYGAPAVVAGLRRASGSGGRGTRYLERQARAAAVPELDPVRPALAGLVRAERAARGGPPPLLACVYHLVDRGQGPAYRAALRGATRRLVGVRVRASGPWVPYAFAPGVAE
jgi:hypothetical protein